MMRPMGFQESLATFHAFRHRKVTKDILQLTVCWPVVDLQCPNLLGRKFFVLQEILCFFRYKKRKSISLIQKATEKVKRWLPHVDLCVTMKVVAITKTVEKSMIALGLPIRLDFGPSTPFAQKPAKRQCWARRTNASSAIIDSASEQRNLFMHTAKTIARLNTQNNQKDTRC